jgi:hypothetical protein
VVAFCGLSISLFLIFSKGYSPQWIINLLPFIVLLLPDLRGVVYCLLLMGANVLEFPVSMVLLANHPWLFIIAVLLRTALLVLVSVELGLVLFPSARIKRALGLALASLALLTVVGGLPVGALAVRDYSSERFGESPYRETIDYLRAQPPGAVVFTDQSLYQQLYAFLVSRHGLYLLEANDELPTALGRVAQRHQTLYVVYTGSEDDQRANPVVEDWLNRNSFSVSGVWLDEARVKAYSTPSTALEEHPLEATFAESIELNGCSFESGPQAPGDVLHVSLSWRLLRHTESNYAVFVHLVDEKEKVWAQHDGPPVGGSRATSSWASGEEITDNHGLALPPDISPGSYTLAVGLYDPTTGDRLSVAIGQSAASGDTVVLGPVLINETSRGLEAPGG